MKIKQLIFISLVFCFNIANAQIPEAFLQQLEEKQPIQKVYLQTDRSNYIAGQTTWLKAYISTHYLPDTISTSLYVEFIDPRLQQTIRKITLPVFLGAANGYIDLPDSLPTGYYQLRSYTPEMLARGNDFVFQQNCFIYGKGIRPDEEIDTKKIIVNFFPEGGNLVATLPTTVAFKAYTEDGLPKTISGKIINAAGQLVAELTTQHDGMGMFDITPTIGEKYYATINGSTEKFALPTVNEKGVVLTLIPHPQGSFFEVKQKPGDDDFAAAYMIGQMQHQLVFKKIFSTDGASLEGVINTTGLRSGIMQVTIFNKKNIPLVERLCFVKNKEYVQPISLFTDTLSFSAGGRNRFSIQLKDTVQGQLSIAVTDPAMDIANERAQNIVSTLLLTADVKGYVHNPAWYFLSNEEDRKNELDLIMMTNGWRRFNWATMKTPLAITAADPYITIRGKAYLQGTKKPFADKQLLLMISNINNKSIRSNHFLQTNKDGVFKLDSLVLFDKNRLLFSDVRGKKSQYIDIELSVDTLFTSKGFPIKAQLERITGNNKAINKWQADYEAIQKANGLMLEGITVKTVKKSPLQVVDDNYTSGLFSGDAIKAIDLINSDEASTYMNIFDYLQSRVNGLTITNIDLDYGLFYRQAGGTVSSMGNVPMTLFLDEIETDPSVVATIPANQIALVKIYSSFAGGWGNSPGGAMAIYTKKGADYVSNTSFANIKTYNGYTITKEFFAPNYKLSNEGLATDLRHTIDWRPTVFVNSINPRIPFSFYNNNRTQSFKVVIEGMTTSGKLIWLEQVVTK
jgi:hypothetical protein